MSAFGGAFGTGASAPTQGHNPNNDVELSQPPTDGISSLKFSPVANHLIATSWDNQVRCWEVQPTGQSVPKASTSHEQPVLCADWSSDGTTVFSGKCELCTSLVVLHGCLLSSSRVTILRRVAIDHAGGCDKQVKMWSLTTNQTQVVAKHDAPITHTFFVKELNNMLVTGSWDRTVKYWDLRQPNPVHSQQMPERVYAMDVRYPLLVVGTAARRIQVRLDAHSAVPPSPRSCCVHACRTKKPHHTVISSPLSKTITSLHTVSDCNCPLIRSKLCPALLCCPVLSLCTLIAAVAAESETMSL